VNAYCYSLRNTGHGAAVAVTTDNDLLWLPQRNSPLTSPVLQQAPLGLDLSGVRVLEHSSGRMLIVGRNSYSLLRGSELTHPWRIDFTDPLP